ncbi:MAG: hypothetical protein K2M06_04010 [Muribaculaceae bacterium]|nr:hypothetical protein [Muribaculaceae bacterium]
MGGIGSGGAREGSGRKATDGARVKISVRVPEWLIKQLRAEAERRQLTDSQLIIELLTKGFER